MNFHFTLLFRYTREYLKKIFKFGLPLLRDLISLSLSLISGIFKFGILSHFGRNLPKISKIRFSRIKLTLSWSFCVLNSINLKCGLLELYILSVQYHILLNLFTFEELLFNIMNLKCCLNVSLVPVGGFILIGYFMLDLVAWKVCQIWLNKL